MASEKFHLTCYPKPEIRVFNETMTLQNDRTEGFSRHKQKI